MPEKYIPTTNIVAEDYIRLQMDEADVPRWEASEEFWTWYRIEQNRAAAQGLRGLLSGFNPDGSVIISDSESRQRILERANFYEEEARK